MTGQSETKHTPGELHVVKSDTLFMLESEEGMRVARTSWHGSIRNPYPLRDEAAANAARIALTWNCHDELVAALETSLSEMLEARDRLLCTGARTSGLDYGISEAHGALAKAKARA